jgi:type II secretion system protein D
MLTCFVAAQAPPPAQPANVANAPANAAQTNAPTASTNAAPATNAVSAAKPPGAPASAEAEDQLSFQGANIDMVVQWLAKATGKSVVKHPRVQCQLTIVGSKGLKPREAVNLVYRALALEGFTAIESSKSILIVPEGSEPKGTPEFLEGEDIPEGRQRLMRIFQLQHVSPADLRDKIKTALTDKATIEVNERGNQLIISDYTDNIRLVSGLIKELDVASTSDTTVEFLPLKHGDAEDVASLLGQILNAQVNTQPQSGGSAPSSRSSNGMPPGFRGGMMMSESSPSPSPTPSGPTSTGNPNSSIKIWPDRTSNQLIVVAPKDKIAEIKNLLEILDTDKPQDVTIRIIALKNVNAEDLVHEITPLLQKMTGKSARERVEVSANARSNSLIILSSEENFNALQKLISGLDREDAQERATRAFPLQNADAEDVAKQLQDLQQDQNNSSGYPYRIFFGDFGGRRDNKKINVVADRRRNTVIVQAPPTAMDDLEKLVKQLDEPVSDASLAPKIYRMKYVSAADIADVLNELFLKKTQQRSYWDPYGFPNLDNGDRDARAGNKLYGKVRITSEPYSNSIIITSNSSESLAAIEAVLNELDSPSQAGETTMRITLNFARATTLATSLNILFAKGGSPQLRPTPQQPQQNPNQIQQPGQNAPQQDFGLEQEAKEDVYFPWIGGNPENTFGRPGENNAQRPVSDLIGRVRVVPDQRSNSILLTSNLHFFPQILKLISELDAPTPQVLVEARIIEVSSDFRDKIGVRWSPDGSTFTGEDLEDSARIQTSTAFKDIFTSKIGGDTTFKSGIFDSTVNLDFLVQFLRKNTDAKILAEPQMNIADNEAGKLFVGARIPFISGSLNTDVGGRNDTFQYRDVGIILEVIPHINSSNEVAMKIHTESSSIRDGLTYFNSAVLDTRNFRTEVMVKDGSTLVLGGIIQREQSDVVRKVPGLGSIPGLGVMFRKKDKVSREVELMVFLRPKITRTPEQAHQLYLDTRAKVPLINSWDENVPQGKKEKDSKKDKSRNSDKSADPGNGG